MIGIRILLLAILIICAFAVSFSRSLLISVSIYMAFSLVMSVVWVILESPDLAITEAAVGAGVTGILFFVLLKKINAIYLSESSSESILDTNFALTEEEDIDNPEESFIDYEND